MVDQTLNFSSKKWWKCEILSYQWVIYLKRKLRSWRVFSEPVLFDFPISIWDFFFRSNAYEFSDLYFILVWKKTKLLGMPIKKFWDVLVENLLQQFCHNTLQRILPTKKCIILILTWINYININFTPLQYILGSVDTFMGKFFDFRSNFDSRANLWGFWIVFQQLPCCFWAEEKWK